MKERIANDNEGFTLEEQQRVAAPLLALVQRLDAINPDWRKFSVEKVDGVFSCWLYDRSEVN